MKGNAAISTLESGKNHCFLLDGSVATSCSNGSKVQGASKKNLIGRLDVLPLWNSAKGFLPSDVDWEIEVTKEMNPTMTTLSFELMKTI